MKLSTYRFLYRQGLMTALILGLLISWGCHGMRYASFRIGWAPNIKVLASSSEEELSFVSIYTEALVRQLSDTTTAGLEEAQAALEKKGIPHGQLHLYPQSTNRQLHSWQKSDHTHQRFALLIGGPAYAPSVELNGIPLTAPTNYSGAELDRLEAALGDIKLYGLPESHFYKMVPASSQDVAQGILWLADKLAQTPGAEGLIMFCSHGNQSGSILRMPWDGEGDGEGTLYLNDGPLAEATLKKWVNSQLGSPSFQGSPTQPGHAILIIILACRAGAFTA